jgi:hypothetical protein
VDVAVPRLAAEAHEVEPFGGQLLSDRLAHQVHQALQCEVLLHPEVGGHLLPVGPWGDQRGAEQRRVPSEEGNGVVVGPDKMGPIPGVPASVSQTKHGPSRARRS